MTTILSWLILLAYSFSYIIYSKPFPVKQAIYHGTTCLLGQRLHHWLFTLTHQSLQFSLTTTSPLKPCRKTVKNSVLYHPRAASSETQKWAALHLFDLSWLSLSILISPCIFWALHKEGKSDFQVIIMNRITPLPSAFTMLGHFWVPASQPSLLWHMARQLLNSSSEVLTLVL